MKYGIGVAFVISTVLLIIGILNIPKKNYLKPYFVVFSIFCSVWLLSNFLSNFLMSVFFVSFSFAVGGFLFSSYTLLAIKLSLQDKEVKTKVFIPFIISAVLIFVLSMIPNFFADINVNGDYFDLKYHDSFNIYFIFILLCFAIIFYRFIYCVRHFTGIKKNQAKYILTGGVLFTGTTFLTGVILPSIGVKSVFGIIEYYYFDTISSLFFLGAVLISLAKTNLMEIDLAWRHSLKNIIYFALFTSCLFGLNYGFFKRDYFIVSTSSILIILLNYFKPKIDDFLYNIFLKKYKTIWNNLKEAGKISHNIYETKAIIDILVIDIPKALNIENAVYYSLDESNQKYSMYQTNQENKRIEAISLENILAKQLTEKRQFMYVNYLDNKDVISVLEEMNIELCYPIFYQDILNGILVYGKKQDKSLFNNEELTLLSETIEKAEIQINNIIKISHISSNYAEELLKKYKNTNQKMLLNETKRLSEIRDIDLLCEHSKKVVNRLLNVKDVEIFLYDRVNKKDYVSTNGTEEIRVNEDNYLVKYLIQTNEIVATADLKKWAEESKLKDLKEAVEMAEKIKARFVIPLTDKKLLGFLIVDNKFESLEYTQDDFVFLSVIKNTLEITIRNIYLNEKSQKDPLTKLYNRNFLDARLEEEIIQGFRECVPVSYLMIDGDSFKKFNDENGHDAGDKVLIEIASCIKTTIRPSDEVCRYGGEEFSVICTGTKNDGAVMLGNRINEAFRVNPNILKLNEMYGKKITVSIGVSTFHNKDSRTQYSNQEIMDYCQKLKNKGDEAMYEAKRLGKDRSYNGGEFEKI